MVDRKMFDLGDGENIRFDGSSNVLYTFLNVTCVRVLANQPGIPVLTRIDREWCGWWWWWWWGQHDATRVTQSETRRDDAYPEEGNRAANRQSKLVFCASVERSGRWNSVNIKYKVK